MKRFLILLILPLLIGCKANYPVAQQSGKEDMAFLLFISSDLYAGKNVEVIIDDKAPFEAEVVKAKKSNRSGTQYGISTGAHSLKVIYNGETLYEKKYLHQLKKLNKLYYPNEKNIV